ncbi:MAG: iron ABC transporter permease [Planctomycetes bacterium]|nr:iron ABC transporter permease [Planctomycetota bacterium]
MISCVLLERPGKWRTVGVAALLLFAMLPAIPLLHHLLTSPSSVASVMTGAFASALRHSLPLGGGVAAISFLVGLPLGVLAALYEFPARRILLALATLPLLVPSFLWAIGWSSLAARLGPVATNAISGFSGCVLVFSSGAIPLALLTSYAACTTLSGSQLDAARLAGADKCVLVCAVRHAAAPTLLAACLGGILTLSDPGPGQILGLSTAASELLTTFSAQYDFSLAARQCLVLTAIVLALVAPLAYFAAPCIAREMLAKQSAARERIRTPKTAILTSGAMALFVLVGVVAPIVGLTAPIARGSDISSALSELLRTATNTLVYAAGAGVIAVIFGMLLAVFVGRNSRLRTACLGVSLTLFALPPAFLAIGIVQLAAEAPSWADVVLRSRLTVCMTLALRFFPVAAVLALRSWGSSSSSWALVGGLHGVSLPTYLRRVAIPLAMPAAGIGMLVVALLATADIGTVLLLHPPGQDSFPLAIFTVMANARESFVAALCLVYILAAGGFLTLAWMVLGGRR